MIANLLGFIPSKYGTFFKVENSHKKVVLSHCLSEHKMQNKIFNTLSLTCYQER